MHVFVFNIGSSSIKFHLYEIDKENLLLSGLLSQISEAESTYIFRIHKSSNDIKEYSEKLSVPNYKQGIKKIFSSIENYTDLNLSESLHAIGHRVVHGGSTFVSPTLINDDSLKAIRETIPLAPLHNSANLSGIEIAMELYPHVPQVAVFDTSFFQTLPEYAYRYALPDQLCREHKIRRYGFHGTSHQYVAKKAANFLKQPLENLRLITLHLGNGASAAAILNGRCIDTSMGMTPLEGLIMGTRCGDLDPSIPFYLSRCLNLDLLDIEKILNNHCGIQGLCGTKDMREAHNLANQGDKNALMAIKMYCYRICKYVGAYYTVLAGLDALAFTAGIGENDPFIRKSVCDNLSTLGIHVDSKKNQSNAGDVYSISHNNSGVEILVVTTNEEIEIAKQTVLALQTGDYRN